MTLQLFNNMKDVPTYVVFVSERQLCGLLHAHMVFCWNTSAMSLYEYLSKYIHKNVVSEE